MPGNQECVDLVADILIRQAFAGDRVLARQHEIQKVVLIASGLAAFADDIVDQGVHVLDITVELIEPGAQEHIFQRQSALQHGDLEGPGQSVDKGVEFFAIEGVEAIIEAAQTDRVEGQPDHVAGDINLIIRIQPLPFQHQLFGNVDHHGQVIVHRFLTESRHQDIVRLAPVWRCRIPGEQAVPANDAQTPQRAAYTLVEPGFIAQLSDQVGARDKHDRRAHHVEPEDRSLFVGEFLQTLQGCGGIDGQDIAQQGRAIRLWDGC